MSRKKYVVIMAAGSGSRMGGQIPKQFLELDGKAILRHTIELFTETFEDITVITVLPEQYIEYWKDYCYRNSFICPQILVKGGFTRFHSVKNALEKVPEGALVAIHDGVRPLASPQLIRTVFKTAEMSQTAVPVVPCVDTMKILESRKEEDGSVALVALPGKTVDRSVLYGVQTPQAFHSEVLKEAYGLPFDTSFTDDASVVERNGKSLSYVVGERLNMKITTCEDLVLAEAVMKVRKDV